MVEVLVVEDEEEETSDPTEAAEAAAEMGVAEEVEVATEEHLHEPALLMMMTWAKPRGSAQPWLCR